MKKYKIILSGGGTGGHIYPAVAVAEALRRHLGEDVELLFVGAEGKMEMEKIPSLGYRIVGLPVAGLQRRLTAGNLSLPIKIIRSLRKARRTIRDFGADMVVGFGGYASAPVVWSAQRMGIPTLTQEQNSYAGMTNKMLGKRAEAICVAYEGMSRFFPADKIVVTGNPLRGTFSNVASLRGEAMEHFGLDPARKTLFVVGGSLGTRTLNNMMKRWMERIVSEAEINVIWQTGRIYQREMEQFMEPYKGGTVWHGPFIERMDYAYAAADVVISRSGAGSVSELSLAGKPVIFVPSPNVAEDHQTRNAMALVDRGAALMVPDGAAVEKAIPLALDLLGDSARREELARNIGAMAIPDSADRVVGIMMDILEKRRRR